MSERQLILVPRLSRVPEHELRARKLLDWLVRQNIVEALPTTCGRGPGGMAYAIGEGAKRVALHPELLPYGQRYNGLEIVTRRCIYTPTRDFHEEAGCPECRKEIGEAFFDSLDEWSPGDTDNFTCPECGYEDEVNGFLFLQSCAFSNLGLIFNGWAEAGLKPAFIESCSERLGFALATVYVDPD